MNQFQKSVLLMLSLFFVTACPSEKTDKPTAQQASESTPKSERQTQSGAMQTKALEQGRQISQHLLKDLKGALMGAIKSGGTEVALNTCNQSVSPLTKKLEKQYHAVVKRVSFKTRNPKNSPDEFESMMLKKLSTLKASGNITSKTELFERVDKGGKSEFRYAKPIMMKTMCLKCHGNDSQIKPGTAARLKSLYPKDQAKGYQEGDLRGIVSVRFELPQF